MRAVCALVVRRANAVDTDLLLQDLGYLIAGRLGFALQDMFSLDALPPGRTMRLGTVGDIVSAVIDELEAGSGEVDLDLMDAVLSRYALAWRRSAR